MSKPEYPMFIVHTCGADPDATVYLLVDKDTQIPLTPDWVAKHLNKAMRENCPEFTKGEPMEPPIDPPERRICDVCDGVHHDGKLPVGVETCRGCEGDIDACREDLQDVQARFPAEVYARAVDCM